MDVCAEVVVMHCVRVSDSIEERERERERERGRERERDRTNTHRHMALPVLFFANLEPRNAFATVKGLRFIAARPPQRSIASCEQLGEGP